MSKSTRKARAAAATPGTIAADHRVIIEHGVSNGVVQIDQAGSINGKPFVDPAEIFTTDELAEMPLVIRKTTQGTRVRIWRDVKGNWWRTGGALHIRLDRDGRRVYRVTLFEGATERDLKSLQRIVTKTRTGASERAWVRSDWEGADDRTLWFRCSSFGYVDPFTNADHSPRVVVCDEPLCKRNWHEENGSHLLDQVSMMDVSDTVGYEIAVRKDLDDDHWYVDLDVELFYGSPEDVANFVSDLQWMQEECRRANQPPEPTAGEILQAADAAGVKPSTFLAGMAA